MVRCHPTRKVLSARLIDTMARTSPQASPYNSDDEDIDGPDYEDIDGEDEIASADGEGGEEESSEGEDGDEDYA